jgi:predicted TIM-barrel enzyme/mannose-6-phosphate isomerase-like protein (cupin superfamily)
MGRDTLLARLRAKAREGKPVIGAGAGTGLSAKCAEAGGADLIIIYNSGRYRMAGRGSLAGLMPYGDANAIVVEMAGEVLPVVRDVPVLAGVCGTDPFRLMPRFLDELAAIGFAGVQNFPTVGLIDGVFRQNLEETGMSYAAEVEMIRLAAQRGLVTCPYVFDPRQAEQMARAGADVLVPHMGLTTSGTIGAQTALTLDEAVARVQAMRDAAARVNPEILVLCHGGPIAEPADAGYVLARTTGVCGFFGASSMERLPVERALTAQVRAFTELSFRLSRAGGPSMTVTHIKPAQTETFSFEWGTMKWFVSPVTIPGAANSQGEVIINPGQGHVRHLHEHADELIYVISGTGVQTVGDDEFPVTEGDAVYIPMATLHSTMNTGWRTLRLIVTYTPGGEEQALTALPDFTRHPAGEVVGWQRTAD